MKLLVFVAIQELISHCCKKSNKIWVIPAAAYLDRQRSLSGLPLITITNLTGLGTKAIRTS